MRFVCSAVLILSFVCLSACAPSPSRYVTKEKYDELQNKLAFVQAKLDEAARRIQARIAVMTDGESKQSLREFNHAVRLIGVLGTDSGMELLQFAVGDGSQFESSEGFFEVAVVRR